MPSGEEAPTTIGNDEYSCTPSPLTMLGRATKVTPRSKIATLLKSLLVAKVTYPVWVKVSSTVVGSVATWSASRGMSDFVSESDP